MGTQLLKAGRVILEEAVQQERRDATQRPVCELNKQRTQACTALFLSEFHSDNQHV